VFPVPVTHPSILCVDDYETSLAGWCLYLQNAGYSVTTARTPQEGLERFAVAPVDLVLLDYLMPESNGDDVAAMMKRMKPGTPEFLAEFQKIAVGCDIVSLGPAPK